MTYEEIKNDPIIRLYVQKSDETLGALGFTEHSFAHVTRVAVTAGHLLDTLGYESRMGELARIAGFLHDVGNMVTRVEHSQSGALIAMGLLEKRGFSPDEIATVVSAIGNHDEGTGVPVNPVAAALILADKSDVRRTRVRAPETGNFDIHDRVNYSVTHSELKCEKGGIHLCLTIDSHYSSVMDYFEIFLDRMILCRKAAVSLGQKFALWINDQKIL